jgi:cytochrome c biogenesis protein CcmG, thiol:disulfide interchange protein DsbE
VRRRLVFTGIGCVLAGLLALGLFGPWDHTTSAPSAQAKLPPSLPSVIGHTSVTLPKLGSPQREPVVITFFASWCGPCEAEMPALVRFVRGERAKGAKLAFIGIDENDQSGGAAFTRRIGVDFPVGSDKYGVVLEDLGAPAALPQTIFVNVHGDIVHHTYGPVTDGTTLETWVHNLLST